MAVCVNREIFQKAVALTRRAALPDRHPGQAMTVLDRHPEAATTVQWYGTPWASVSQRDCPVSPSG
ncbi:hypothetical protein GCM10012287_51200 [Streptomyces daqingensis]|uniref:Uncharacterized protein n=1 Tax=Streptomyces daqingensis TaxID=1472640 RepID=A0ABQ2MRP6_9ACTN|nr:hypothetical protein GCM10012287_51200 [Streptomyces daqingensis]